MNKREMSEFHELCDAFIEGSINDADKVKLETTLRESESARLAYVHYSKIHSSLMHYASESDLIALPGEVLNPAVFKETNRNHERPLFAFAGTALKWAAVFVVGLLAASLFMWDFRDTGNSVADSPDGEEAMTEGIAVLIQAFEVNWGERGRSYELGDSIPPGHFQMESGVALLEFHSGATMILEGETDLEILSSEKAFCHSGKLTVTASPHAKGFAISTPDYEFVDLGTEFGLTVEPGASPELHVFSGEVEVYAAGQPNRSAPFASLKTGDAARFMDAAFAKTIDLKADLFWNVKRLVEQTGRVESERFDAWNDYSKHIADSDGLIAYFPFYQTEPWVRKLENAVAFTDENSHGAIVGSQWVSGRWPRKSALRFNNASDRVRFNIPGEYESITLVAWVKVESLKNLLNGIFMTDLFKPGNPHWQINQDGQLQLGIKNFDQVGQYILRSPPVIRPSLFGQWIQLASTFDGRTAQTRHYLNGELISESLPESPTGLKIKVGPGELGNRGLRGGKSAVRNFHGAIDEVLLYGRVLNADEIATLYEMGHPTPRVSSRDFTTF